MTSLKRLIRIFMILIVFSSIVIFILIEPSRLSVHSQSGERADAIVVWQHQDVLLEIEGIPILFGDWDIWYSVWDETAGTWWTPTGNQSSPIAVLEGEDVDPAIAFDGQGNALVVWAHNSSDFDIWYSYWTGINWTTPTPVDTIPGHDADPAVAYDPSGQAIAIWTHDDRFLYYARWDGASWTRGTKITPQWPQAFNGTFLPEIAFISQPAPKGSYTVHQALAIWTQIVQEPNRSISRIYYVVWSGVEWVPSPPEPIPSQVENATSNGVPSTFRNGISSDRAGNAIAVWATASESKPVYYALWNGTTASWHPTMSLEAQNVLGKMPAVAFDSINGAILTYTGITPNGWLDIRYSRWIKDTGWTNSSLAANSSDVDWRPSIAFSPNNKGVAVWWMRHPNFANTEIFYSVWNPVTSSWTVAASIVGDIKPPFPRGTRQGLPGNDLNPAISSNSGSPTMPMRDNHDIAIIEVKPSETLIAQNHSISINVTIENQGAATENFNVTAYYNTTAIATQFVTDFASKTQTTLIFVWNTTGVMPGIYILSAQASIVPNETDTADNTFIDGTVTVMFVHDIAVTSVAPSKTVAGQGYFVFINVTVKNQGDFSETFNVTALANATIIQTLKVTLTKGTSTSITFAWNTTGFAKGNYTISAIADTVLGETDTADNNMTDGWVIVAMVGDVTGNGGYPDGEVNIRDIAAIARSYGSYKGHPRYVANYDLDCNGDIDIRDVAAAARNFGKVDP